MNATLKTPIERPASEQALLRLFAAVYRGPQDERVRYLAEPCYHMVDGRMSMLAGDGHVFVWCHTQVAGFRDYVIPPAGGVYYDLASVFRLKRQAGHFPPPVPGGPDGRGTTEEIVLPGTGMARVRRWDMRRLHAFDTCRIAGGERITGVPGLIAYRTLCFQWTYGRLSGAGVVMCQPAAAEIRARKVAKAARK